MLMTVRDEETGSQMSDKQLRDEVMTFFLAGHETTAKALTWTFYLLSQHVAVRSRLEREVALKLVSESAGRAAAAGLPWRDGEMLLRPAERLVTPDVLEAAPSATADDCAVAADVPESATT